MMPRTQTPKQTPKLTLASATITIPISPAHLTRLAQLNAEQDQLIKSATQIVTARRNELLNAIIGVSHDPETLRGYAMTMEGTTLVLTPPVG